MKISNLWKVLLCILVCLAAGWIGSVFTSSSVKSWYPSISKPAFNPPNWVFGPVWTVLFVLMGVALYLVVRESVNNKNRSAIYVFTVQLFLNVGWSVLFFGLKSPFYAFAEILVLWAAITANIIMFYSLSKKAAYLLVPYILWVSFAAVLNYSIWVMN